jgi:type IV secretory pathway VirJ component
MSGLAEHNRSDVIVFDAATSAPLMIVSGPSTPVTVTLERSHRARPSVVTMPEADTRQRLVRQAAALDEQARMAAGAGDLEASAKAILEALDCERRAGGLGLQVLQLIKPRS